MIRHTYLDKLDLASFPTYVAQVGAVGRDGRGTHAPAQQNVYAERL
jgi:hypothetical protein